MKNLQHITIEDISSMRNDELIKLRKEAVRQSELLNITSYMLWDDQIKKNHLELLIYYLDRRING